MGLRILTVAWMQKESLLSTVSENWTLIFKSRKSEKPCMDYWAKKNPKNCPKACSKHVWTLLESIKSNFWILMFFWLFWKFSKARPSMEHWAKLFFGKIAPKHVQSKFGQNWERFWAFLDFWKILLFSKMFEDCMEHWAKKLFQKNRPKTCSKHVWILLWTILGLFGFLNFFEDSNFHGTLGKFFFQKNAPKHIWTLENDFGQF